MSLYILIIVKKYIWNILISIDQLCNTLLGGLPDETISSRIGKFARKHGGKCPKNRPLTYVLWWILEKIDYNHCIDAIEEDE